MAIFTLEEIETQFAAYKEASIALAVSKEYTVGGKTLRREDLAQIREHLKWLDSERQQLLAGSSTRMQINIGMARR